MNAVNGRPRRTRRVITSPAIKFAIGVVAGLCATLFPRLVAELGSGGRELVLLPLGYVAIALAISLLLGCVMAIVEWRLPAEPGLTFMKALGIPAVLCGALNSSLDANAIKSLAAEKDQLAEQLGAEAAIPILPAPVGWNTPALDPGAISREGSEYESLLFASLGIAAAEAQTTAPLQMKQSALSPAPRLTQAQYYVVLARGLGDTQARQRAEQLRQAAAPRGTAVLRMGRDFAVVLAGGPLPKSDAVLQALELKKRAGLAPALVAVSEK